MLLDPKARKYISKHTGLTGVEAGNIAKKLEEMNVDYQVVDWKTIGEDLYGHGKRTSGVKHHLKKMYGLSIDTPDVKEMFHMQREHIMEHLMRIHNSRSVHSIRMDLSINARKQFKPTNKAGVKYWKKFPHLCDIIGIDDIPGSD